MLTMVVFGAGEFSGGFLLGYVVDRYGLKIASLLNVTITLVMFASTLAFVLIDNYNWLAYATAFIWGIVDSAIATHS